MLRNLLAMPILLYSHIIFVMRRRGQSQQRLNLTPDVSTTRSGSFVLRKLEHTQYTEPTSDREKNALVKLSHIISKAAPTHKHTEPAHRNYYSSSGSVLRLS